MVTPDRLPIAEEPYTTVRVTFAPMEMALIERACGPDDRWPDDLRFIIKDATMAWAKDRLRAKGFRVDG